MRGGWHPPIVAGMTTDTLRLDPVSDLRPWARVFAAIYDPFLWIGERAGMAATVATSSPRRADGRWRSAAAPA